MLTLPLVDGKTSMDDVREALGTLQVGSHA
jgi:hypothetical protein